MAKLTTTTYAILGLLARQPWSAYDLTKHMQQSGVRAVWPRTESRIYLEFKNLVAHKLATCRQQPRDKRKRSVYTITAKGLEALDTWLRHPEGSLRIESEPLLKLLYTDLSEGTLEIQLTHMRKELLETARLFLAAVSRVNTNGFFFKQNASRNAMLVSLLTSLVETRYQWLEAVEARLARLKRQRSEVSVLADAHQTYRESAAVLSALIRKMES